MYKILMLVQGLKVGGLENVASNLSSSIKNLGLFDVEICCYDDLGFYSKELKKHGIVVHFLPRRKGLDFFYPLKLKKLINDRKIDIIHAHNYTAWFYGALASFLSGKKIVYTEHDNSFSSSDYVSFIGNILEKITAKIVTVSEIVKINFKQRLKLNNVEVIYNGINEKIFKPIENNEKESKKKQYGFCREDFLLGTLGRMDNLKNQEILIEIMPWLKDLKGRIKLLFIGDGQLRNRLQQKVDNLNLKEDVIFMGERQDVPELLSILDIFLLPSLSEGLPLSVIEAMAVELPIIASRVGGMPELIQEGKTGILVKPGDKEEIVTALKEMLNNSEKSKAMGKLARKDFLDRFSLNSMVDQYQRIYQQCVG